MLFNSLDFCVYLPCVFILYWFIFSRQLRAQNALIAVASYVFYGWWDWRFLLLIFFSTLVDYTVARKIFASSDSRYRKRLLTVSLITNLGLLGFFKYYNFFVSAFTDAFTLFGQRLDGHTLSIILPVGISFYTFQTLSYTIDVYRKKLPASGDFIQFSAFVSFFPQLVAGPIERATSLLPQFGAPRKFEYDNAMVGVKQILWGLFKKMVVADNCAVFVNQIFDQSENMTGSSLLLGAVFFAFQIYGDFSGYSDIAIGTARLFGFSLMRNFAYPYFARDVAEFWRRWHISLSTWFRDYLYIPLGGSRGGKGQQIRNTFLIFLVSGFWHGANWTFIVWGLLHALYFLPLLLTRRNRRHLNDVAANSTLPGAREALHIAATFFLVTLAWVFFRADSVNHAITYLAGMADASLFAIPDFSGRQNAAIVSLWIIVMLSLEYAGRHHDVPLLAFDYRVPSRLRFGLYYLFAISIFLFAGREQAFIYFQF